MDASWTRFSARSTGGGDLEEIALADIRFEDITPTVALEDVRADRSSYRREDDKSVTIAVRNHTDRPRPVEVRVTLHDDLDAAEPLGVARFTVGAGERADTRTLKDPIVGFVFDVKGLMADISLKGAKITKLDKSK